MAPPKNLSLILFSLKKIAPRIIVKSADSLNIEVAYARLVRENALNATKAAKAVIRPSIGYHFQYFLIGAKLSLLLAANGRINNVTNINPTKAGNRTT